MISRNFSKAAVVLGLAAAMAFPGFVPALEEALAEGPDVQKTAQGANAIVYYEGADNQAALNQKIQEMSRGKPLFVMYYSKSCGVCEIMTDDLAALTARKPDSFSVLKIEIGDYPVLGAQFRSTPQTDTYLNGRSAFRRIYGWGSSYMPWIEKIIHDARGSRAAPSPGNML